MRTRPVSNNFASHSPETQRKNVNFLNSNNNSTASQQRTQAKGNVKPDPNRYLSPDVVKTISNYRAGKTLLTGVKYQPRAKIFPAPNFRNSQDDESDSDAETVIDSLYDNEDFQNHESETMGESEFEIDDDVSDPFQNLQEGLNGITNSYVHTVKTQIEEAMSSMKKHDANGNQRLVKRADERGAGDKKSVSDMLTFLKKVEIKKRECHRKIMAVLQQMNELDDMTRELMNNHFSQFS